MEKNMYVVIWQDVVNNVDSRTFIEAENAKEAEMLWRQTHPADLCRLERIVW